MKRLALVTGASAGIGAAFARELAAKGFDLAITARRTDRLEALAAELRGKGAEAIVIAADLAKADAPASILEVLGGRGVDVLVNNAGYGLPGTWARTGWVSQAEALQVMLTAPLELTHRVLPAMAKQKYGRILNVASLAGFAPGARGHTTYAAMKSALIKFSQSLNIETRGMGVHVTAVCPGFTHSEFHDVNGMRKRMGGIPKWLWQTAEQVAAEGWRAVEKNRAVIVTGAPNKVAAGLMKAMPDGLALWIARTQADKVRGSRE